MKDVSTHALQSQTIDITQRPRPLAVGPTFPGHIPSHTQLFALLSFPDVSTPPHLNLLSLRILVNVLVPWQPHGRQSPAEPVLPLDTLAAV